MQVVFHLGAPCTDDDKLIGSLLKNRQRLAQAGVSVPPTEHYREAVREALRALQGPEAGRDVPAALLDAIHEAHRAERLVLSDPRFVCINRLVVQRAQIWPMIERVTLHLRGLFPQAKTEFFIGMRNPATLIPALFRASRFSDFAEFSKNMQPHAVAWSEMLQRLHMAHPDCPITVWCNEDTPLLWSQILREMAGLGAEAELEGGHDLVEHMMAPEGFARLKAWLAEHPPETEAQHRRVLTAFLERYVPEDELDETLHVPGWSAALVDEVTERYDNDLDIIATIPNLRLLMP